MATEDQRFQAICDALMNQASTAGQRNRIGTAIAIEIGRIAEYQAGTSTQKARIALDGTRGLFLSMIRSTEASAAANAAAETAAANAANALPETP